jgi:hypothetical protein
LRGKNKSFIEDTIILIIIGIIIYAIYSFFFASTQEVEMQAESNIVERSVSNETQVEKESISSEKIPDEKINEDIVETQKEESLKIDETTNKMTKDVIEVMPEDKIEDKLPEKETQIITEVQNLSEITDVELFYKSIEEKIYTNIKTNVAKDLIRNNDFVNIRLTILKDGRYEQLTFMDGNKENFELFRSSITKVFPIKMNDNLKENFPRYFRMKIEVKEF